MIPLNSCRTTPPALTSQTWADDYNQVKTLGAINSTVRTPAQTEIGSLLD